MTNLPLKTQLSIFIRAGLIPLAIMALITCCEFILISENVHFLESVGKGTAAAFMIAGSIAVSILFISIHYRKNLAAMFFVAGLVFMQVFFSGYSAVKPQLSKQITAQDRALLSAFQDQAEALKQQINSYSDKYRTRKAELTKERSIILGELKSISDNAGNEATGIEKHLSLMAIALTVFQRIALELIAILLCHILGRQFAFNSQSIRVNAVPVQDANALNIALPEPETSNNSGNAKDIVLSIYSNAICKSQNGRKGPFTVFSDETEKIILGRSQSNFLAWNDAADRMEQRRAC